jgi:pimeloyl-ACP methyl ester carboxylesterase
MLNKLAKIVGALAVIAVIGVSVFWFSRPADLNFDELRSSVPFSEYSHFAVVDGVRMHYQEKGSGTPLVLIHGYTSSTYSWKDVFEPLSQKYRVIAVDLKGFGFSEKPDGDYSRRAQAILVGHLLEQLKIDKAWICGNSMGGETAINVALQFPERVAGLVLIDSAGIVVPGATSLVPWYLSIPVVNRLLSAFALIPDKLVREGLGKSFYDPSKITPDRVAYYHRPLKTRGGQLAAMRARAAFGNFPVEPELGKIKVPTLLIWGAEDNVIPLEAGRKINSLIKESKLVVVDQCGHVPQEEMPERVLAEISIFVTQ